MAGNYDASLPEDVISELCNDCRRILGENLVSVVMYPGALAGGMWRAEQLPMHAIVVTRKLDVATLDSIRELVHRWQRRVDILLMTRDEVLQSVDVFPIEFLNIQVEHQCPCGEDVFAQIDIYERALRRQVEEDLKAKLMDLRQAYVYERPKPQRMLELLGEHFNHLAVLWRPLLHLKGQPLDGSTLELMHRTLETYGVNKAPFETVLTWLERRSRPTADDANKLLDSYLTAVGKLIREVEAMSEGRPKPSQMS